MWHVLCVGGSETLSPSWPPGRGSLDPHNMHPCPDFKAFVETNLSGSASARKLKQHLCDFDARTQGPPDDSPRLLVSGLRHTLLCGLSGKQRFGIPNPTPRVIGLFDLSGEKSLLVSESTHLLRAAIFGFSPRCHHARHHRELETLVQWADKHEMGLLCVAILPWQTGVGWAAFEIRTFAIRGEGPTLNVQDGHRFMCNHLMGVRDGSSTFGDHGNRFDNKEVRALADDVCAVSLDRLNADEPPTEKRIAVLQETARRLAKERQLVREEHALYKQNEEERVSKAVAQKEAIALEQHVLSTRMRDECQLKLISAQEEVSQASSRAALSEAAHTTAMRANAELSLHLRECEENLKRQKSAAALARQCFNQQLSQLKSRVKKATDAASDELDRNLHEAQRQLRQVQDEYQSLSVTSKAKIHDQRITIQKLTEIIDRKEDEYTAQSKTLKAAQQNATQQARVHEETLQREKNLTRKLKLSEDALGQTTWGPADKSTNKCKDKHKESCATTLATGPTSITRNTGIHVLVQTATVGCGTTAVASTQTEDNTEPNEPLGTAEVAKSAYRALHKLIECAQSPRSPYVPAFYGHQHVARFRPPPPPIHEYQPK